MLTSINNHFKLNLNLLDLIQYVSTAIWIFVIFLLGHFLVPVALYILFYTEYWYFIVAYFIWFAYDFNQGNRGGRKSHFVRNFFLWRYVRDYLPIRIIKTSDLDPNKNYIGGCHPHGVFCLGPAVSFGTNFCGVKELFPNIKIHMLTISWFYSYPFIREILMAFGCSSVNKENINWILTKQGKGNFAGIVIGGAVELLDAQPNTAKLVLKRRKGFVRLAIKNGASLIPIYAFGENELFKVLPNTEGSIQARFQNFLMKNFGFPIPLISGRALLPYTWSFVPFKHPVDVVVGKPIDVVLNPDPTNEEVDRYHDLYVKKLTELFEDHKQNYEEYKNCTLEIM